MVDMETKIVDGLTKHYNVNEVKLLSLTMHCSIQFYHLHRQTDFITPNLTGKWYFPQELYHSL
jgi:hypothetical protein